MSTDCHISLEVKFSGVWHHLNYVTADQYYDVFQRLAGVRGDDRIEPMKAPCGHPEDITAMTRFLVEHEDAHTLTWLDSKEVAQFAKWWRTFQTKRRRDGDVGSFEQVFMRGVYLFGGSFESWFRWRDDYPRELEDFRFIIWFDN